MNTNINNTSNSDSSSLQSNINFDQANSSVSYARWYSRLAASLVDGLILAVISFGISFVVFPFTDTDVVQDITEFFKSLESTASNTSANISPITEYEFIAYIATLIFGLVYFAYFQSKDGQTLGMRFIGIKISKEDGNFLSFGEASIRFVVYQAVVHVILFLLIIPIIGWMAFPILLFLWVGWCLFDKKKQNPYDKVFNSVYTPKNENKTAAKFVVGCCCGAQLLLFISIAAVVILALSIYASNASKSIPNKDIDVQKNAGLEVNSDGNSEDMNIKKDFLSSCNQSFENRSVALSPEERYEVNKYCECANEVYTQNPNNYNVKEVMDKCPKLIINYKGQ